MVLLFKMSTGFIKLFTWFSIWNGLNDLNSLNGLIVQNVYRIYQTIYMMTQKLIKVYSTNVY